MRLGFYGNYTKETAEFAEKVGFRSMELSAWPDSSLNAEKVKDEEIKEIKRDLEEKDIEISSLGYYPNYLTPNEKEREKAQNYFIKLLDLAEKMGINTVSTFAGRNPNLSIEENIPLFKKVFTRFTEIASNKEIRIAIENCPMMDHKTMKGLNIAYSPEIWDKMFEVVPSDYLGIELDPAHMVWLGIDYIKSIYEYGDKIFHVHAKDMEIRNDILSRVGIYGKSFGKVEGLGHGWWRARTPGWGEVDWQKFITALLEINYEGNIDIEHEDDVFAAAAAMETKINEESDIVSNYGKEEKGLILGFNTLSKLIPKD